MKVQIVDDVFVIQFIKESFPEKYWKTTRDGERLRRVTGTRVNTYCKIFALRNDKRELVSTGKSSCSPLDKYNHVKGKRVAMSRAISCMESSELGLSITTRMFKDAVWSRFNDEYGVGG